jgi:hypothetical protein
MTVAGGAAVRHRNYSRFATHVRRLPSAREPLYHQFALCASAKGWHCNLRWLVSSNAAADLANRSGSFCETQSCCGAAVPTMDATTDEEHCTWTPANSCLP